RRAVLQAEDGGNRITLGELVIDKDRHEVTISGTPVPLTASEFKILSLLAAKPSWVFSRDQILSTIHDGHIVVTDRTVDVQIVSLRKKLGPRQAIETVRGVGYKLSR
ncbi:MAG TPA: winged helix family transcriptional regulator, partial [Desulfobacterales bacterium]|nr:winged helix family transcriptional regulator [Desulfobacterales bacterium]